MGSENDLDRKDIAAKLASANGRIIVAKRLPDRERAIRDSLLTDAANMVYEVIKVLLPDQDHAHGSQPGLNPRTPVEYVPGSVLPRDFLTNEDYGLYDENDE